MIIASNEIVKRIVTALNSIGVGVYSVVPPVDVLRYIHVDDSAETAINEKLRKITEGFITINVIEKFRGDDGSLLWVTDTSIAVVTAIQPLTASTFGISGGIEQGTNLITGQTFLRPTLSASCDPWPFITISYDAISESLTLDLSAITGGAKITISK